MGVEISLSQMLPVSTSTASSVSTIGSTDKMGVEVGSRVRF